MQHIREIFLKSIRLKSPFKPPTCEDFAAQVREIESQIRSITEISRAHLTPEIQLHLVTSNCHLWHEPGDKCPFVDPFWAFYWPGGQALTRFILDKPEWIRSHNVLDVGSGCGASAIAAVMAGASSVTANDICPVAEIAIAMNSRLNKITLSTSTEDYIGKSCTEWDTLFLGDMFYDPDFTDKVFHWLLKLRSCGKQVLIGDPGRISLLHHPVSSQLKKVATYELHPDNKCENNGLSQGHVWSFE